MNRFYKKCCLYLLGSPLYRNLFCQRGRQVPDAPDSNEFTLEPNIPDDRFYDRFYCFMRKNGANSTGIMSLKFFWIPDQVRDDKALRKFMSSYFYA